MSELSEIDIYLLVGGLMFTIGMLCIIISCIVLYNEYKYNVQLRKQQRYIWCFVIGLFIAFIGMVIVTNKATVKEKVSAIN